MKNIYFFPFTHINREQLHAVTSFFSKIRFLNLNSDIPAESKLAGLMSQGYLVPVSLPGERVLDLDRRVQSYLDWAKIHQGNERNLKSLIKETAYFREDTGLTAIQSQIRRGRGHEQPEGKAQKDKDPLLFMKFAEMWDMEKDSIQSEISALDADNFALFAELKGDMEASGQVADSLLDAGSAGPGFDPGQTMTEERIRAWIDLAGEAGLFADLGKPQVLVTTSSAVMDYLMSNADQVINGLDIESIKVHENGCARKERWQQDMINILDETLLRNAPSRKDLTENAECCALSGQIQFCLLSGEKLDRTFKMPGKQVGKPIAVCLVKLNS